MIYSMYTGADESQFILKISLIQIADMPLGDEATPVAFTNLMDHPLANHSSLLSKAKCKHRIFNKHNFDLFFLSNPTRTENVSRNVRKPFGMFSVPGRNLGRIWLIENPIWLMEAHG